MLDYDIDLMKEVITYNHNRYLSYKNNKPFEYNIDYERILTARYMKVSRIKKRLIYLLSRYQYIWFCTFTFDDYYINKCDRTKRDLIKSCINYLDFKYILNVDYGKQTERQHYHCILATDYSIDISKYLKSTYPCFSSALICRNTTDDLNRLSKYINKLSNHCIKATTNRQRVYYNFKGYDDFNVFSEHDKWIIYKREMLALLDKANISGKIS